MVTRGYGAFDARKSRTEDALDLCIRWKLQEQNGDEQIIKVKEKGESMCGSQASRSQRAHGSMEAWQVMIEEMHQEESGRNK